MKTFIVFVYLIFNLANCVCSHERCPCNCTDTPRKDKAVTSISTNSQLQKYLKSRRNESYHNIRLPENIAPIHYDVFLDVNLTSRLVNGTASIKIVVTKPTKYVIIHAVGYIALTGYISRDDGTIVPRSRQFTQDSNEYYVMHMMRKLLPGYYQLRFKYSYRLRTALSGFYHTLYKTKSGKEEPAAFTQFQPTDARGAFPCFDEPALRATFDITIGHEKEFEAISNMPIIKSWYDESGERRYDQFSRTPVMPTYLLAFAICKFANKTIIADTRSPVKMTFYAPPDKISQINYAVTAGRNILPFFEKYYNISYPLPKADMIAVPDFAAGGMENWGLITYKLRLLLFDEVLSSLSNKILVTILISHELAHMWFGNLVTVRWWSDLWLNEGFASYVTYLGINATQPEWEFMDFIIVRDMAKGMELDALVTSHPIYIEVKYPDQINEIFDSITYRKGACVVRMLDNFLGTNIFVKGLNTYLNKYSYGSARTEDLWKELTKASHSAGDKYNVSQIMDTWIYQMGFPVVTVKRIGNGIYNLTQTRFFSDRKPNLTKTEFTSPYGYKWIIPFNYITLNVSVFSNIKRSPVQKVWMNLTDTTIDTKSDAFIIKGNAGQYGFFRVNYDAYSWQKITTILKENHRMFEVKDRVGLLQDAFALAASGRLEYSTALELFDYIHRDSDYLPWKAAIDSISYLARQLSYNKGVITLYQKFIRNKIWRLYNDYKFDDVTEFLKRKLQILIVSQACSNGHKGCLKKTSEMFNKWMKTGEPIPSDFQALVLYYGVYNGGEKEWKHVFDQYLRTNVPTLRFTLMNALCATQQSGIIDRLLHHTLNSSIIKSQDVRHIFVYIAGSSTHGRYHTWYFLKENWELIVKRFSNQFFTISSLVPSILTGFTTEHDLEQAMEFFTEERLKPVGQLRRALKQTYEEMKSNIEWLKENQAPLEEWLRLKLEFTRSKSN